ncbi:CN hydrolase domain-containing protein [Mycena venus]|uniref:CN hydrolase domain-containing protein n=1 Tax=Mycena venus TaxID=2733690 RepID=A0A8H6X8T1_9AGAR|nr:CN hydrolase domain-containing protein [Mycena venus]
MALETTPFVFTCPQNAQSAPGTFLKMTANRYSTPESRADTRGLTLVFGHGAGAHKEQWNATIEEIFSLQPTREPYRRVHDAWSLDCMNTGDAALLNREELFSNRPGGISALEWGEAIASFLRSPELKGKRAVLLAHSYGALAMRTALHQVVPCTAIILVEPFMMPVDVYYLHLEKVIKQYALTTASRREKWNSREEAHTWFKECHPYDVFEPRVFKAWMIHGLVETVEGGVTLKCDRLQEAGFCHGVDKMIFAANDQIARVCRKIPVHIIWGIRVDPLAPQAVRDSLSWISNSIRVPGGHPENPAGVAVEICRVLDTMSLFPETQLIS